MLNLQRHWYRSSLNAVTTSLLPLSGIFSLLVSVRRFLYRSKVKKTVHFPVPVIVVGNITVGGTGKTPFVIWLAKLLKEKGFKPGIVSRGVGGKQQLTPRWIEKNSDPQKVGDEAILLAQRSECPVVIGIDRVVAVKELLAKTDCNLVISDDGLQHYRLGRNLEIAIVDGDRGLGNKQFLPAGPLREAPQRLHEVDFVVVQGVLPSENAFSMQLHGEELASLKNPLEKLSLNHFLSQQVHAVAAIGNPQRFFASLRAQGLNIIEHVFPDHYLYQADDFNFGDSLPIIMTEKDAVKCQEFADERFWCLPVEARVDQELVEKLLDKIKAK